MNDAIFAIPGLMPPTAPNFHSRLIAPEDGSLCLCVHCGRPGDNVNYAVDTPGWFNGVIKDPSYNYGPLPYAAEVRLREYKARMPQFLTVSDSLPPDALVPRMRFQGCPVPITERPDVCNPLYWILRLPIRTLPVGDTVVEVVVNGRLRKYIVQRPKFAIHSWRDITPRFSHCMGQYGEAFDVSVKEGQPRTVIINLIDALDNPEILNGAEYRAECVFEGKTTELQVTSHGPDVMVQLPALEAGYGLWKAQYKLFDDWIDLAGGDLVVTPDHKKREQTVTLEADQPGSFEVSLINCIANPEVFAEAEFKAELIIDGNSVSCVAALKDDYTVCVHTPAMPAGDGIWIVQYKLFEDWLDLSAGAVKIIAR